MDAAQSLQDALVEILSGLEMTSALADRRLLLTLVSDACPGFPDLAENPVGRLHVIEIVRACVRQPAALWALSRALETMAPRNLLVARARRLIELATVVDLTSAEARRIVHGLLASVKASGTAGDVRRLWYRAAGPWAPIPATPVATLVAAFDHLASVNAQPGGLPPALAFVEYVAADAAGPAGRRLREWAESEAARIGVVDPLLAVREEASAGPEPDHGPPCLVVQLSRDGISPDYVLSHWIQHRAGPWQPERGQDLLVPLARVGSTVDLLVDRAEVLWKSQRGPVSVEFVLPIELLNRALEWEPRHLQIPRPIPLCLQYPVVLRSLERMRAQAWHRVWHNRWAAMAEAGQVRLYNGADRDEGLDGWTSALLSDEGVASVALRTAPDAGMGREELSLALTFGVPVMFWDRRGEPADELGPAITTLVEGDPASLPQRVMRLRHEAVANSDQNSHIGRHLAVLWDDPTRLVDTGGSG